VQGMNGIAIIGLACIYPDARGPEELWDNVLAQRRAFRRMPAQRLPLADYGCEGPGVPDRTYVQNVAVLEGYEFDRERFRVGRSTFEQVDLTHWLALEVADGALRDAGFARAEHLPREDVVVIVGNTLTGEFSRASVMRLRWPYVRRVVDQELMLNPGWSNAARAEFLARLEARYKAPFPTVSDESLAGGLSNTIAGRICNQYDLKGGGYTVDAACASSLLAVIRGCQALEAGDADFVLAGGVDMSLDPFELVGFAKLGALAPEMMRVFDQRSRGFWPGEGCGFVALCRAEDAISTDRRVYATIKGWGISSDGKGGITRPEIEGQLLAMRRAYHRAGVDAAFVPMFEAHGTGTSVGDNVEIKALRAMREGRNDCVAAALGSIKANIGHTKAAAGVAGLIKATLALHNRVLPPTTGCEEPNEYLSERLRVLSKAEPFPEYVSPRAGVSAFGFGGINTHVVLEGASRTHSQASIQADIAKGRSYQDAELFLFAAVDPAGLRQLLAAASRLAADLSWAETADLAAHLAADVDPSSVRAALVASSPQELRIRLDRLLTLVDSGQEQHVVDPADPVFMARPTRAPRVGYLFPGQGAALYLDGGAIGRRFAIADSYYADAGLPTAVEGADTAIAQPAIVTASAAAIAVLGSLGLEAEVAVGHSLGELSALFWAGSLDWPELLGLARARGAAMADFGSPTGAMASISASPEVVRQMLGGTDARIACFNGPEQTVVSGGIDAVTDVVTRARQLGKNATRLAVSHAFHSPLVAAAVPSLARHLSRVTLHAPERHVVSTITGDHVLPDDDLRQMLCDQVCSPVRFVEAVTRAADSCDLMIEVGPGAALTGLLRGFNRVPAVPIDAGGRSLAPLLTAVGIAWVLGAPVHSDRLFGDRVVRPKSLEWRPRFLINPCEAGAEDYGAAGAVHLVSDPEQLPTANRAERPAVADTDDSPVSKDDVVSLLRELVSASCHLPLESIRATDRMLSDLHLSSIKVGEIVVTAAGRLRISVPPSVTEFADTPILEIADALVDSGGHPTADLAPGNIPGLGAWVRPFVIDWESSSPPAPGSAAPKDWHVIYAHDDKLGKDIEEAFLVGAGGDVVVVCIRHDPFEAARLLMRGAQVCLENRLGLVVLQRGGGGSGFARSFFLESKQAIPTTVVTFDTEHVPSLTTVLSECHHRSGFREVRISAEGNLLRPVLRQIKSGPSRSAALNAGDVVLVTGGGKGIGAECGLELAKRYGCSLAVVGRSNPDEDLELANNLTRLSQHARVAYAQADVGRRLELAGALDHLQGQLGPITAVVHSAGVNAPELLTKLADEQIDATISVKVSGLSNLLCGLDRTGLRLVVAFGSVIARSGLPGEAHYALANEYMSLQLADFARSMRGCRCLCIEWSLWSGAGMGEKLGVVRKLAGQGLLPITVDQGLAAFIDLLESSVSGAVIVMGRTGLLPTLDFGAVDTPSGRFTQRQLLHYPGVELITHATISCNSDPYLADHVFAGDMLLPGVLALEAAAQVACTLSEQREPPVFEQVAFLRPIVIPPEEAITIRVLGLVTAPGVVDVAIRTDRTGYQADHFSVRCRFDVTPSAHGRPMGFASKQVDLDPRTVYDRLLFHGAAFQRLARYRTLSAIQCTAEVRVDPSAEWFADELPNNLVLGDPGFRDCVIHCIQPCVPHITVLPVAVESVTVHRILGEGGAVVHARQRGHDGSSYTFDVVVTDFAGRVAEEWTGLRLVGAGRPSRQTLPQSLVAVYLERRLSDAGVDISRISVSAGRGRSIRWRKVDELHRLDGKPDEGVGGNVSRSYAPVISISVEGDTGVACDVEAIKERDSATWQGLLGGNGHSLAGELSGEVGEDVQVSATRVWSARECVAKAGLSVESSLVLSRRDGDLVILGCGDLNVVTVPLRLDSDDDVTILAVLLSRNLLAVSA